MYLRQAKCVFKEQYQTDATWVAEGGSAEAGALPPWATTCET